MKYLIQNKKEFAITVGVFGMTALNLGRAIKSRDVTEDVIVAFVLAVLTLLGWYYNMPTSETNSKYTGKMRLEKERPDDGEDFFEEIVEVNQHDDI